VLWYEAFKKKNSTLFLLKNHKNYNNRKVLNRINNSFYKNVTTNYILNYHIPYNWDILFLRNTKNTYYVFLYSNLYYLSFPILTSKNIFKFDKITKQVFIKLRFINNFSLLYFKLFQSFYQFLLKPTFCKIKFKGKGYYIYKNYRNTITPQFGYSHRFYLYAFFTNVLFLSKTSLIVFGINHKHVTFLSSKVWKWRPINLFTGRGIRFSKQIVYKKSGKVSTYR